MESVEEWRLKEYLADASEDVRRLAPGFASLKWGPEEVETFMKTARASGSFIGKSGAEAALLRELDAAKEQSGVELDYESMRKAGHHVTALFVDLTEDQKRFMRQDLAGITTVQFPAPGTGERVKHAVPHAMRSVMSLQMFRHIPKTATILEVGGSMTAAVKRGVQPGRYFTARPIIDIRDAQRFNSERRALEVMLRRDGSGGAKAGQAELIRLMLAGDEGGVVFRQKIQELRVAAEYVISVHSNWDIPMAHVPAVMRNCGSRVWYMVMDRIPGLAYVTQSTRGVVDGLDLEWEADVEKDLLTVGFRNDTSMPYVHKLSVVREYQGCSLREFVCQGRLYVVTEAPFSSKSQLVLVCTDMGPRTQLAPMLGRVCTPSAKLGMIEITVPMLRSDVADDRRRFKSVTCDIGEDVFSRVLQDRMIAGTKGSVDTIVSYARTNRVSVIHNGVRVSVAHPVAVDLFRHFAVAVNALAEDMARSADKDVDAVSRQLASGSHLYKTVTAWLGDVSERFLSTSSLIDAISNRVQQLLVTKSVAAVKLRRHSGINAHARVSRCEVDINGDRVASLSYVCPCEELKEVRLMLDGQRGMITHIEEAALNEYARVLQTRVDECQRCVSVDDIINRAGELAEEEEEFFECEDDVGVKRCDSGYSSASCRGDSDSVVDSVYDGEECEPDDGFFQFRELEQYSERFDRWSSEAQNGGGFATTRMRKAAVEYVKVLEYQMRSAEDDLRQKLRIAGMAGPFDQRALNDISDGSCWYTLASVDYAGRVSDVGRDEARAGFQWAYDWKADKFVPVESRGNYMFVPPGTSSCVYSSQKMTVWNQPTLIDKSLRLLTRGGLLDGPEVRIPFVNGVFGCGKTRGVIEAYKTKSGDVPRLIITSTRKSAEDVRETLFGNDKSGRVFVRTYDSVLMHGVRQWFPEVVFDEFAALCMGQAVLLLAYLKPLRVRAYGDFMQMEYKPFCDFDMRFPSVEPLCDKVYLSTGHRTRLSVMAASLSTYADDALLNVCQCCDHVLETEEGGPELVRVTGLADVPMRAGVTYLTVSQEEKRQVREALANSGVVTRAQAADAVCTYAESQGITRSEVICVRLNAKAKPGSNYHELKRANVGRSRSVGMTKYYTVSDEIDAMVKSCRDAANPVLRQRVRDNGMKVREQIQAAGGYDEFIKRFFELLSVKYV